MNDIGMSLSTVTAARIYKGQKAGNTGEEEQLTFDRFPYMALSRVCVYTYYSLIYFQFKNLNKSMAAILLTVLGLFPV